MFSTVERVTFSVPLTPNSDKQLISPCNNIPKLSLLSWDWIEDMITAEQLHEHHLPNMMNFISLFLLLNSMNLIWSHMYL